MHRYQVSQHKPDAAPCLSQCLWVCMPVGQGQAELWALRASSLRDLSVAHHLGRKLPQTEGYSLSLGEIQEPPEVCDCLYAACEVWESLHGSQRKPRMLGRREWDCLLTGSPG